MIVLVSGGSGGLGSAICRRLGREGHSVAVGSFANPARARGVTKEISEGGGRAISTPFDVTDLDAVNGAVEEITDTFKGLDALVLSAAYNSNGLIGQLAGDELAHMHRVNVMGVTNCIQAALPHLLENHAGRIVLFSSVLGRRGYPGVGGYSATKGAVESLTTTLAVELGGKGITVNAVAPGMIDAGLGRDSVEAAQRDIRRIVPMRRAGRAEDVAGVVAFLLSEDAAYVNGTVVPVDGGLAIAVREFSRPGPPTVREEE